MEGRIERSAALAAGDVDAFWSLIQPHDRGLRRLAYRLVEDRDAMDDVLQEAYLKAFRGISTLGAREAVGPWLSRIVYNAAMDLLRLRQRHPQVPLDAIGDRPEPGPDPGEVAADRRDLATALASLPPGIRAAVLLVDAEGLSYEEAGAIVGVPAGTIGSRVSRARKVLRRALGAPTADREAEPRKGRTSDEA